MAAAQTKGHEEDKHTEMKGKQIRKERKEKRRVGSKAQKQARKSYSRRVSIATNLPVSATKPRRGPPTKRISLAYSGVLQNQLRVK